MMILLNGHSLTPKDRFFPDGMGLQLSERQSTATLTLSPSAPVLGVDDWVTAESGPGAGIVWRVKTVDEQVEKKTRTITLEHCINTLRDRIMFGEVTTKMISGNNAATVSARAAVQYVLARQSDWKLGDFAYNVSNPYSFNGDDLFSAMETISGSLKDCIWEYDFRSYPFTLHIRQLDSSIRSEMRMDRNIRTLKKTIDRSRMYTRIYPIGKNNLHIDGEYLSKNENLYGTVSKVETDQSQDTKDKLKAWAQERLDRHCEPAVTVTISGLELAASTGESLDSFVIGKICRVPLPELSTSITERVTKLSYSDVINDPENVTVTLANEIVDVATILKEQNASGSKSGRTGAKNSEEDHAWIVDTTDKVELVAEAVAGKDGDGADWSRVATLTVDGQGIDARVVKAEGEIVTHTAQIKMTEDAITQEVTDRSRVDAQLAGRINVQAGKISLVVEEKQGQDVIKAASIVTAINEEGSEVAITADHVKITGNTTVSGVFTIENGALVVKKSAVIQGNLNLTTAGSFIQAPQYNVTSSGSIRFIGTQGGEYYSLSTAVLKDMIKSASVSGNILTLTPFYGDPINFSKAASTIYGSWSGKVYTVTGGSNPLSTEVYSQIEGAANPNATVYAKVYHDNPSVAGNQLVSTEMTLAEDVGNKKVTLSANSLVKGAVSTENTYNAGRNAVNIVKNAWDAGRITFTKSAGTASTKAVKVGADTGWQSGVFTYAIKDYEDDPNGVSTGYSGQTDLGNPSMAKPSIQPSSASLVGRKRAGTSDISKSAITVNGYLFFDVTVRGQVLKFYAGVTT